MNAERTYYVDSSALVKLVLHERETEALAAVLAGARSRVSCTLSRVEVVRAVREKGPRHVTTARGVLQGVDLVEVDGELLELASGLDLPLRSLDAIHIAAALEVGDELDAIVTYDARMARAAEALGIPVFAPA